MQYILLVIHRLTPTAFAETGYKLTQSLPGSCVDGVCLSQGTSVGGPEGLGGIVGYVSHLWIFGISIGGILALAMIVYGAIEWTVSAGNASKIDDARDRITQAVIGLVLLFGAFTILNFINPALTNFNAIDKILNLEEVKTQPLPNLTNVPAPEAGTPQSHPFDTCIDCVPMNTNLLPTKEAVGSVQSLNDYCNNLESPFNGDCWINKTLEEKLIDITATNASKDQNGVFKWRITEAYPPRSTHSSQCHNKFGTCVDIGLKAQFLACENVTSLVLVLKNVGLNVLNEYPNCAGGTTTEFSTGGHLHVSLPL